MIFTDLTLNLHYRLGKTVIFSIHQPSADILKMFNKLYLMVRGHIVYQGTTKNAIEFFKKSGFECPIYSNPADFFIKVLEQKQDHNMSLSQHIQAIDKIKQNYYEIILPQAEKDIEGTKTLDFPLIFSLDFFP